MFSSVVFLQFFKIFHRSIQVIHGHTRPEAGHGCGGGVQHQREAFILRLAQELNFDRWSVALPIANLALGTARPRRDWQVTPKLLY